MVWQGAVRAASAVLSDQAVRGAMAVRAVLAVLAAKVAKAVMPDRSLTRAQKVNWVKAAAAAFPAVTACPAMVPEPVEAGAVPVMAILKNSAVPVAHRDSWAVLPVSVPHSSAVLLQTGNGRIPETAGVVSFSIIHTLSLLPTVIRVPTGVMVRQAMLPVRVVFLPMPRRVLPVKQVLPERSRNLTLILQVWHWLPDPVVVAAAAVPAAAAAVPVVAAVAVKVPQVAAAAAERTFPALI